ncbi:MAG: response regulator, partial [Candidatus Omnitrophica bacterium]|nr:response regulator [Candidatus Omnitrophota bacterium]
MKEEKPKLLVVDDEPDQCISIKNYFSRRNFQVFTAESGEEALTLIKENKPDLVLLDMKLSGGMDGKGVLQALRRHDKKTKVAVVTGDILSEEKTREIIDLGIVELVNKPVVFEELDKIIRKVLEDSYPKAIRFEEIKPKEDSIDVSLRR